MWQTVYQQVRFVPKTALTWDLAVLGEPADEPPGIDMA